MRRQTFEIVISGFSIFDYLIAYILQKLLLNHKSLHYLFYWNKILERFSSIWTVGRWFVIVLRRCSSTCGTAFLLIRRQGYIAVPDAYMSYTISHSLLLGAFVQFHFKVVKVIESGSVVYVYWSNYFLVILQANANSHKISLFTKY